MNPDEAAEAEEDMVRVAWRVAVGALVIAVPSWCGGAQAVRVGPEAATFDPRTLNPQTLMLPRLAPGEGGRANRRMGAARAALERRYSPDRLRLAQTNPRLFVVQEKAPLLTFGYNSSLSYLSGDGKWTFQPVIKNEGNQAGGPFTVELLPVSGPSAAGGSYAVAGSNLVQMPPVAAGSTTAIGPAEMVVTGYSSTTSPVVLNTPYRDLPVFLAWIGGEMNDGRVLSMYPTYWFQQVGGGSAGGNGPLLTLGFNTRNYSKDGDTFDLSLTVKNLGNQPSAGGKIDIQVKSGPMASVGFTGAGSANIPNLAPMQSEYVSVSVAVKGLPKGKLGDTSLRNQPVVTARIVGAPNTGATVVSSLRYFSWVSASKDFGF
jgi:hypothetical protein